MEDKEGKERDKKKEEVVKKAKKVQGEAEE